MKKTYITPALHVESLSCEMLIAESLPEYEHGGGEQLVKGYTAPESDSHTHSYNVWDDDWSK